MTVRNGNRGKEGTAGKTVIGTPMGLGVVLGMVRVGDLHCEASEAEKVREPEVSVSEGGQRSFGEERVKRGAIGDGTSTAETWNEQEVGKGTFWSVTGE